jgi:hypothetical protein
VMWRRGTVKSRRGRDWPSQKSQPCSTSSMFSMVELIS